MEQKRKISFFIATILILGIFAYVINQGKKVEPTEGITSTWETFEFNDKEFPYPPDWAYEEIKNSEKKVVTIVLSKDKNTEDSIFVGSDKSCEEMSYRLCLGKNPVYTNNQDAEAMQLFNMYVQINENPQSKRQKSFILR